MKLIIAGSRTITDFKLLEKAVRLSGFKPSVIISGGAKGVDTLGEIYAKNNNIELIQMNAEWSKYGRGAGFIRNENMAKVADSVLVLYTGKTSKGSIHMIKMSKKYKLNLYVYDLSKYENVRIDISEL